MGKLGNSSHYQALGVKDANSPRLVYKSGVVACARDTRLVGSRWLSRVYRLLNLHTLGNSR